jgi:hypothetical protein
MFPIFLQPAKLQFFDVTAKFLAIGKQSASSNLRLLWKITTILAFRLAVWKIIPIFAQRKT